MTKIDWHEEYLVKCAGFGDSPWDAEFDKMLVKWKKTAEKIGLTNEDVKFAVTDWMPRHYDLNLEGMRKTIGYLTVELVDLMSATERKARGERIIYGADMVSFFRAMKMTDPSLNTYFVDATFINIIQPFFHKLNGFLEFAEKNGVSYGCRHCAMNKTRYAVLKKGLVPIPDISWIWGFVCDQEPKSVEFEREYWNESYPIIFSRWSHHDLAHEKPWKNGDMVKHLGRVLKNGYERACNKTRINVDYGNIQKALDERASYMEKFGELVDEMVADPPPMNASIQFFLAHGLAAPLNSGYNYWNDAIEAVLRDVKNIKAKGEGIVPKGSPKGMTWTLPFCNPFIMRMFQENGVAIPFQDEMIPSKADFEPSAFEDPFEASAESLLKSPGMVNWGTKADFTIEKLKKCRAEFMLFGFLDFDRWLGSDHKMVMKYVEEQTGIPCYYIEGDCWEDRDFSEESLRTRIETICEIVKIKKGL